MKIPTFTPALNIPPTTLHEVKSKEESIVMGIME